MIAILAVGALYASLTRGPVWIASSCRRSRGRWKHASLSGVRFDIGDAVLRKADKGYGIEFRLANVRLIGDDGERIVEAPLASADVSLPALLRGRLAPRPGRSHWSPPFLHYSDEKGLTISAGDPRAAKGDLGDSDGDQPAPGIEGVHREPSAPPADISLPADAPPLSAPSVDLTKALASAFDAMRRTETAYLSNFGIRDAVVFFDRGRACNPLGRAAGHLRPRT